MNATVTLTCNDPVYVKSLGPTPGVHTLPEKGSEALSVGSTIRDWRFNRRDRV